MAAGGDFELYIYFGAQRPVAEVLAEFQGKYDAVFWWDARTQSYLRYVSGAPPGFNTLETMSTRNAYWMRPTGSQSLTPPLPPGSAPGQ